MKKEVADAGKRAWLFALRVFESEDFKKDAREYREKFNIPEDGFKSYGDASPWFFELYADTVNVVSPEKHSDLKKFRDRFRNYGEVPDDDVNNFEHNREYKIVDAWRSLEDIRHTYAMPPSWSKGLLTVLLTNTTEKVYLRAGIAFGKKYNGMMYNEEIELHIDRFTRKRDIDAVWPAIKQMQKTLWGSEKRVKGSATYEDYKKAADMKNSGKYTDRQIADELAISPSELPTYIKRYYERIGVNSKRVRYL